MVQIFDFDFRANSFEGYSCNCDSYYGGSYCTSFNVAGVSFTVIACCWVVAILAVALVTYRNK